nr:hypothetical protein [uncultured Psychroserpens sp.]
MSILDEPLLDSVSSSSLNDATKETLINRVHSSKEAVINYIFDI